MAKPSYEAILGALLLIGCSKQESAAPESVAPKAAPAASATEPAASAAEPVAAPPPAPAPSPTMALVDAGIEHPPAPSIATPAVGRPPAGPPKPQMKKGASAACGASGCSPDMKKNGK